MPLTSKVSTLLAGEFVLADWKAAKLNVPTAARDLPKMGSACTTIVMARD